MLRHSFHSTDFKKKKIPFVSGLQIHGSNSLPKFKFISKTSAQAPLFLYCLLPSPAPTQNATIHVIHGIATELGCDGGWVCRGENTHDFQGKRSQRPTCCGFDQKLIPFPSIQNPFSAPPPITQLPSWAFLPPFTPSPSLTIS